jgi:hypothetical protein
VAIETARSRVAFRSADGDQRQGGTLLAKAGVAVRRKEPLNGSGTLDVAAGWNKPASSKAEETVEGLRKPEDGTKQGNGRLPGRRQGGFGRRAVDA